MTVLPSSSTLQALAWWEPLQLEMHLLLGVEGEEGEAVQGAGALTMVEATAKEVRQTLATKVSLHFVERK